MSSEMKRKGWRADYRRQLSYFVTVYFLSVGLGCTVEYLRLLMVQMTIEVPRAQCLCEGEREQKKSGQEKKRAN